GGAHLHLNLGDLGLAKALLFGSEVVLARGEVEKTVDAVGGGIRTLREARLGILESYLGARDDGAGVVGDGAADGSPVLPESKGRGGEKGKQKSARSARHGALQKSRFGSVHHTPAQSQVKS